MPRPDDFSDWTYPGSIVRLLRNPDVILWIERVEVMHEGVRVSVRQVTSLDPVRVRGFAFIAPIYDVIRECAPMDQGPDWTAVPEYDPPERPQSGVAWLWTLSPDSIIDAPRPAAPISPEQLGDWSWATESVPPPPPGPPETERQTVWDRITEDL